MMCYTRVFEKNMENLRNHRDIKLVTTKGRRNYLASEQNHQTPNSFCNFFYQQK